MNITPETERDDWQDYLDYEERMRLGKGAVRADDKQDSIRKYQGWCEHNENRTVGSNEQNNH